jgi:hypothetical protein
MKHILAAILAMTLAVTISRLAHRDVHSLAGILSILAGLPGVATSLWLKKENYALITYINTLVYFGVIEVVIALMRIISNRRVLTN